MHLCICVLLCGAAPCLPIYNRRIPYAPLNACACQIADARTKWGAALSAPLVSMLCGLGLTAAGLIPPDCSTYDVVWVYLMPAAAACYLLETDFSALARSGGNILVAFLVGAVGEWGLLASMTASLLSACASELSHSMASFA